MKRLINPLLPPTQIQNQDTTDIEKPLIDDTIDKANEKQEKNYLQSRLRTYFAVGLKALEVFDKMRDNYQRAGKAGVTDYISNQGRVVLRNEIDAYVQKLQSHFGKLRDLKNYVESLGDEGRAFLDKAGSFLKRSSDIADGLDGYKGLDDEGVWNELPASRYTNTQSFEDWMPNLKREVFGNEIASEGKDIPSRSIFSRTGGYDPDFLERALGLDGTNISADRPYTINWDDEQYIGELRGAYDPKWASIENRLNMLKSGINNRLTGTGRLPPVNRATLNLPETGRYWTETRSITRPAPSPSSIETENYLNVYRSGGKINVGEGGLKTAGKAELSASAESIEGRIASWMKGNNFNVEPPSSTLEGDFKSIVGGRVPESESLSGTFGENLNRLPNVMKTVMRQAYMTKIRPFANRFDSLTAVNRIPQEMTSPIEDVDLPDVPETAGDIPMGEVTGGLEGIETGTATTGAEFATAGEAPETLATAGEIGTTVAEGATSAGGLLETVGSIAGAVSSAAEVVASAAAAAAPVVETVAEVAPLVLLA